MGKAYLNFSEVRIGESNWTYAADSGWLDFGESLYLIFQFGFY
jgi:hypothetical protein